ncbi:MAG: phasin family protein [Anaerolineales bacterium]|jgi:poly(hydroxyalkanoate) granule-associated protein
MAGKSEKPAEGAGKEEQGRMPLFEAARKVLLASIGAVALAQDELEDFINKLVEQGEIAEKEGRKLAQEMREKRKDRFQSVEDRMSKRMEESLKNMNVPTKADIEALNAKISALSKKIDDLQKEQKKESSK